MINKKFLTLIVGGIIVATGLQSTYAEDNKSTSIKLIKNTATGQIDWINKVVRVKGQAAQPSEGGVPQRRLKARVAARMEAYRNLAELITGVQVSSESNVQNFVTTNDVIKMRVDGVVKGARQSGKEKLLPDGSIEVELYLPMFGNGSIASALDLGNYAKNKTSLSYLLPHMTATLSDFAVIDNNTNLKSYKVAQNNPANPTGLIIDARDLAVEPAMIPFIVGGGRVIYTGNKIDINPESIVKYGVTDYTDDIEKAKKNVDRIGSSPMIIEAKGATGSPSKTNILLDDLAIKNILDADKQSNFLSKLGVVVVI